MHIWIASFPRSGNTFLRVILKAMYGIGSTSVYAGETAGRMTSWLNDGPPSDVEFIKTHELESAAEPLPALYLVRDGRDCYVSYAHFVMQRDPDAYTGMSYDEVLATLITSAEHFGGWSTHVETWAERSAPTAVVRYEELLADPAGVATACDTLGVALPPRSGQLPPVDELTAIDPLSFRKGTTGSWRQEMTPELESLFWAHHSAAMNRLGYER